LGFDQFWVSPPEFFELQERARSFSSIGAYALGQVNLAASDRPRRVQAARASTELFEALAVAPAQGRIFDPVETRPGGAQVAVLSNEIWRSAFGARPIVGQQIEIDGVRRTIVGIMPPRYDVADQHVEVWLPLVLDPADRRHRGNHYLYLIGRLADGLPAARARAALGAGRGRLLRQFMSEGCLLTVSGAAFGLVVAVFGVRALIAAYPDSLPRSAEVGLDAGVLVFTLVVALATGAAFGFAPLLHL